MKNFILSIKQQLDNITPNMMLVLFGLMLSASAFADGTDILAGTSENLVNTIKGSGSIYLYLAEGIISLAAFIKTKNILVLSGIIVVSVFINVMLKVAGV